MDELPTDFDIIVIGTGMAESIVAAAASRIGKRVLHLDSSDFYGGLWASFNFEGILKIIEEAKVSNNSQFGIFNVEDKWYIEKEIKVEVKSENDKIDEQFSSVSQINSELVSDGHDNVENATEKKKPDVVFGADWTQSMVFKEYRKFNIDLAPKLLFARGELVELLISSNIARYAEFRCVNRVMTWIGNTLEPVPCSRADVFATRHVTVVEKRMLMKLLTSFMEYDKHKDINDFKGFENKTFLEFLKSKKLTVNLIHYVLYAIAGGTDTTLCLEGVERSKRFLVSLGRYGNTPFLWSMYGCGELPQCFCRLCAVFGGVYCLNRPIDSIEIVENSSDPKKAVQIHSKEKVIYAEHVVVGIDKAPKEYLPNLDMKHGISRGVFITNKSILEFEKESLTLLRFPPLDGKSNPVTVIELGPSTSSCPNGLYLLHMSCRQVNNAKEDLHEYAEKLLNLVDTDVAKSYVKDGGDVSKPQVLWSLYFNMMDTSVEVATDSLSKRVHLCSGPDIELDFDHAVKQGREIFTNIFGNEEFLPRAPDPEEIILEGYDAETGPEFGKNESKISETQSSTDAQQHPSEETRVEAEDKNGQTKPEIGVEIKKMEENLDSLNIHHKDEKMTSDIEKNDVDAENSDSLNNTS